jgi:hypothetical protein
VFFINEYAMTKKATMLWGVLSALLLGCLGGLILVSPMLLLFEHISSVAGLALHIQEQFDALAELTVIEGLPQRKEPHTAITHSLSVTIPEEDVSQMLYDSLTARPARFLTVTEVMVQISNERMAIDTDVEYGFANIVVFTTTVTSEWKLRTVSSSSASPESNAIEVKPLSIRTHYWPAIDWIPLWTLIHRERLEYGWLPLQFTTAFRCDDITLQDHELALSIAPTP